MLHRSEAEGFHIQAEFQEFAIGRCSGIDPRDGLSTDLVAYGFSRSCHCCSFDDAKLSMIWPSITCLSRQLPGELRQPMRVYIQVIRKIIQGAAARGASYPALCKAIGLTPEELNENDRFY